MLFNDIIKKYPIAELLLGFLTVLLFLTNLDSSYLWQDEAQRALIAKTILHGGLPLGFDGLNSFSQELGRDYGAGYLWRWHPWLPFYVLAPFFSITISTFTARLPFALFGIATVALTYLFMRFINQERRTALLASGFLASSVPFLLLSRQCNYYSMIAFFTLYSLYNYMRLVTGKKYAFAVTVLSLTCLFHSNYIYCVPAGAAMVGHAILYRRDLIKKLLLLFTVVTVINIPGILWYGGYSYGGKKSIVHDGLMCLNYLIDYLDQFFKYIFPAILVIPLLIIFIINKKYKAPIIRKEGNVSELIVIIAIFTVTCLLLLSLVSPDTFFRYLSPLLPLMAIVAGLIAEAAWRRKALFGIMVVACWVLSFPVSDYMYELTHEYHGPIRGIVKFLKANARPGDVVVITYGDLPVKFYTGLRVVGGSTGEDLTPVNDAQWIIFRKNIICKTDARFRQYILNHVDLKQYQAIRINAPDLPFENRENPEEHLYRTNQSEDPVIIYKRIKP